MRRRCLPKRAKNTSEWLPGDIYNAVYHTMDRKLAIYHKGDSSHDSAPHRTNGGGRDNNGHNTNQCPRHCDRRGKSQEEEFDDSPESGKFTHYSGAHHSIIKFILTHALKLQQHEPIIKGNRTMYETRKSKIKVQKKTGASLDLQRLVCPGTGESLVSVLDWVNKRNATIFGNHKAYIVQKYQLNAINAHAIHT